MRRKITTRKLLEYLADVGGEFFHSTKKEAFRKFHQGTKYLNLEDYFPSTIDTAVNGLFRKGHVEKVDTKEGLKVVLTEKGRNKTLLFKLEELKPKIQKWDGMWRMVFFDVEEDRRKKRNDLRKYLRKLGLKQMQQSVFVGPFDVSEEVKYLREVLDVPHSVKLGLLKEIENEEDLKRWFGLK